MTTAVKYFLLIINNKKARNTIIGIVIGVIAAVLFLLMFTYESTQQNAAPIAEKAKEEYSFWQTHTPGSQNLSCQGERYCSYFKSSVTDWCCYFVGYCIQESGYETKDFGFAPGTIMWTSNLKELGKLKSADNYTPQVGNLIFFDYGGRSHYKATGNVDHIGIVVEVKDNSVTVIAGNEYNGQTSNWATVSYVNKYILQLNDDSIACYGAVGSAIEKGLANVTRNVITHNEVGVFYNELDNSDFGSVIANDNGALSVGAYGWHGNNALSLLRKAYSISNAEISRVALSYSNTGRKVIAAITNGSDWSSYVPDSYTCSCIKAMLLTNAGIDAQNQTSTENAEEYIAICQENNINDKRAIVYCADILNQFGTGSFDKNVYGNGNNGVLYGVSNATLDSVYSSKRAWSDSNYSYETRRKWTYDYLKGLSDTDFS